MSFTKFIQKSFRNLHYYLKEVKHKIQNSKIKFKYKLFQQLYFFLYLQFFYKPIEIRIRDFIPN